MTREDDAVDDSTLESTADEARNGDAPEVTPSARHPPGENAGPEGSLLRGGRYHLLPNPVPNSRLRDFPPAQRLSAENEANNYIEKQEDKDICTVKLINDYKVATYFNNEVDYIYFSVDGNGGRAGHFMNDDHINPNAKMKLTADRKGKPHLCAFAIKDIKKVEEIVYDYGDGDREGQTKEKKHSHNGAGVEVQEAEGEEPGSQDTGKEKKNSGKQV
ncbi:hypothetical protein NDU88_009393 [Pleurodeles waltl]|uniref:SET domain-containing protein n=1 Tax=Pleurodeles waltl TaxID=8319 RepID=A0AAV7RXF8_PLEWA|nr:hypothetical protein NDU88_009393 [Pleurodeles waltl]